MSLPRDLHLWLQSLNLSYPIKHPKRDFSNGFLVAEILSHYLPSTSISIHHYRQCTSIEHKLSNWSQLERVVEKQSWPITRTDIDALLHSQPDSHIKFLSILYKILTGKTVQLFTPPPLPTTGTEAVSTLFSPTASTVVKNRLNDSDIVGGLLPPLDSSKASKAIEVSIDKHEAEQRIKKKKMSQQLRQHIVQQRMMQKALSNGKDEKSNDDAAEQCTLKAITVRQSATPNIAALVSVTGMNGGGGGNKNGPAAVYRSSLSALNAVIINSPILANSSYDQPYNDFINTISSSSSLLDIDISTIIDTIITDALPTLVHNALLSPKDFYLSISYLFPLLSLSPLSSLSFQSSLTLISMIGTELREKDSLLSKELGLDYLLLKLITLANVQKQKLHVLLPLIWSYIKDDEIVRGALLSSISQYIGDPIVLLSSVSTLLVSSLSTSSVTAALSYVDTYLGSDDAVVRGLALSLLAPIAVSEWRSEVEEWWSAIESVQEEDEWCVKVEAVHVACCLLVSQSEIGEGKIEADHLYQFITRILSPILTTPSACDSDPVSFALAVSVVPHLSSLLGIYPNVRATFFILLSSSSIKQYSLASILPTFISSSLPPLLTLFTPDFRSTYSPLLLTQSLIDILRSTRSSSLTTTQVELLACSIHDATNNSIFVDDEFDWSECIKELREYILSSLLLSTIKYSLSIIKIILQNTNTRGHMLKLFLSSASSSSSMFQRVGEELLTDTKLLNEKDIFIQWLYSFEYYNDNVIIEVLKRNLNEWKDKKIVSWEENGLEELLVTLNKTSNHSNTKEEKSLSSNGKIGVRFEEEKERDID